MTDDTVFEFDLVFSLPADAAPEADILDAVFEAGGDDAVAGLGAPGMIGFAFRRRGRDGEAVIAATVAQILPALPAGSRLREVKPDLVSLAEVAGRLAISRQALQKRPMPAPSQAGLYRAAEIAGHLRASPGRIAQALAGSEAWFAAAPAAQRLNARLSLGTFPERPDPV